MAQQLQDCMQEIQRRAITCPTCNQKRVKSSWTRAQWFQMRPNVGGRNECRTCWRRGPTSEDWIEVEVLLRTATIWENENLDLRYQNFLISFLKEIGASRKGWSYHGVLPVRVPSDFSTSLHPHHFDPTNYVYHCVVERMVPDLQRLMAWAQTPTWCTMGDCIESLLAYDSASKSHQWGEVDTVDAARFFRELSYIYYRINRVLQWDYFTTKKRKQQLHQVLPPKRCVDHELFTGCLCNLAPDPHPTTMSCSMCGVQGCGMVIHLYAGMLHCKQCATILKSKPARAPP